MTKKKWILWAVTIASFFAMYFFWKCYNYTTEKNLKIQKHGNTVDPASQKLMWSVWTTEWGLLKNCWGAKGKQTTIVTLQGGHYESNRNILHKLKKTSVWRYIWRHFCTLSKELSFISGTAISTSYKNKSPRLSSCYKCEYALSLFYHSFKMLGYFHWHIKICL